MLVGHFDKWGKFLLSCLLLWIRKFFQKGSTHEGKILLKWEQSLFLKNWSPLRMELQWKTANLPSLKLYHFIQVFSQTDKLTFVCLAFTCEYLGTRQQDTSRANKFMVKGCTANVFQPLFIGKSFVPSCLLFWIMNSFQNGVYSWRFISMGRSSFKLFKHWSQIKTGAKVENGRDASQESVSLHLQASVQVSSAVSLEKHLECNTWRRFIHSPWNR